MSRGRWLFAVLAGCAGRVSEPLVIEDEGWLCLADGALSVVVEMPGCAHAPQASCEASVAGADVVVSSFMTDGGQDLDCAPTSADWVVPCPGAEQAEPAAAQIAFGDHQVAWADLTACDPAG